MTIGAGDDDIGVAFVDELQKADRFVGAFDHLRPGLHIVPGEIGNDIGEALPLGRRGLRGNGDDGDVIGDREQGKRIRNRAAGLAGVLPADDDLSCRNRVAVAPDHQKRPAGTQDDGRRVRAVSGRHQHQIGDTGGRHDRVGRRHRFAAPFRLDPVCRQMEERGASLLHALCERSGGAKPYEPSTRARRQIDRGLRDRLDRPLDIEIDENGLIKHAYIPSVPGKRSEA